MANKLFTLIFLMFVSSLALSEDLSIILNLSHIEKVRAAETGGDDLYLNIDKMLPEMQVLSYQIPVFPLWWSSNDLSSVKNVPLWRGILRESSYDEIEFTLMERDLDADDFIDSINLKLSNHSGHLSSKWEKRRASTAVTLNGSHIKKRVVYSGNNSEYILHFDIQAKVLAPSLAK